MYITQADAILGAERRSLTNQAVLVPGKTYESSNSQVSLVGHCGDWSPQTFWAFYKSLGPSADIVCRIRVLVP